MERKNMIIIGVIVVIIAIIGIVFATGALNNKNQIQMNHISHHSQIRNTTLPITSQPLTIPLL